MKASRTLVALTMLNVALCVISLSVQLRPAFADRSPPVLRGSALQIIDGQGRIRASIDVLPACRGLVAVKQLRPKTSVA